ncbi:hypothetical protein ZOSMA_169G00440 [Zostera marina]|uniref:Root UVB sensitive protein C-terminal domain-containing protein n=1 Tax=Zostera marina TaxID=29655 RepID=A0A0K9PVI1_ZOSMR|nr:hypothetical protein ZOSMA_169G00440 [Zostera marina]
MSFSWNGINEDMGFQTLSPEAKFAALRISQQLLLGCTLSEIVHSKEDTLSLFDLFKDEAYMLAEKEGRFCVVLKEGSLPEDMLKAVFHTNYLYWLETNVAWLKPKNFVEDCMPGGMLQLSLDYTQREFNHVKNDSQKGWLSFQFLDILTKELDYIEKDKESFIHEFSEVN